jgi:hypothetical protein
MMSATIRPASGWAAAILLSGVLLAGCSQGSGREPDRIFRFDSFRLTGSLQEEGSVRMENLTDGDGAADRGWVFDLALNGGGCAACLPADLGDRQTYQVEVVTTRASDGEEFCKRISVTLHDQTGEPGESQ